MCKQYLTRSALYTIHPSQKTNARNIYKLSPTLIDHIFCFYTGISEYNLQAQIDNFSTKKKEPKTADGRILLMLKQQKHKQLWQAMVL